MRTLFSILFLVALVVGCAHRTPEFPGLSVCSVHDVRAVSSSTGEVSAGTSIPLSSTRFLTCLHVTDVPNARLTIDGIPAREVMDGRDGQSISDSGWEPDQRDWVILETSQPVPQVTVPAFWHGQAAPRNGTTYTLGFRYQVRGRFVHSSLRELTARIANEKGAPEDLLLLESEQMNLDGLSGGPILCWDADDRKWKVAGILVSEREKTSKIIGRKSNALVATRIPDGALAKP